jgi:cytochrome bd-type quinol oxidase subunit 1
MDSALVIHGLHFAFTITYHYLFPQLTMGLAPLIVVFKSFRSGKVMNYPRRPPAND